MPARLLLPGLRLLVLIVIGSLLSGFESSDFGAGVLSKESWFLGGLFEGLAVSDRNTSARNKNKFNRKS